MLYYILYHLDIASGLHAGTGDDEVRPR